MKLLLVLSLIAVTMTATSTAKASKQAELLRGTIDSLIADTQHMQRVMGTNVTQSSRSYKRAKSIKYVLWVKHYWKQRHREIWVQFRNPPHYRQFMCIHKYEGSWTDSGAPYYGGLQMDYGFQSSYAPELLRNKGTADHWTPLEQIWTAEKAYVSRGFNPWPNTARYCGLL